MAVQRNIVLTPKTTTFRIPEQDFFKYDTSVKNEVEYYTNAYHDYTSGYATSLVRSTSEMLFERYCETRSDIEWVYKNGDTGQQYFSIVYIDGLQHQWLFYADYIVKKMEVCGLLKPKVAKLGNKIRILTGRLRISSTRLSGTQKKKA